MKRAFLIVLPALLAGCGTLPQPFLGRPGREGALLAVPPPPALIVPAPRAAMLSNNAATLFAQDLANALVKQDVPSIAHRAKSYEWQLNVTAKLTGQMITPEFEIVGPNMKIYGHAYGIAVPADAWANGDSAVLKASALEIAPKLAKQLATINALVQQSNPQSLANRPPHVHLTGVIGAPGDGDHSLALDIARDLPKLGLVTVAARDDADFVVIGTVSVTPNRKAAGRAPSDLVELTWTVRNRAGQFVGKVTQLHDLKPSEMAPYWGDVAAAAAEQAAIGIRQVIANATPKPAVANAPSEAARPAQ